MGHAKRESGQLAEEVEKLRERIAELEEALAQHERLEESLQQSKEFLQTVLDEIADPTMVIGPEYRIVLANRAAREMAGGEDPAATGLTCYQISHRRDTPCEGPHHQCPLRLAFLSGTTMTVTHTHYMPGGKEVLVQVKAAPILNKQGDVIHVIESCRDVSKLGRAEEALPAEKEGPDDVADTV
jgi:PAS domain S-box-containing protein